MMKIQPAHQKEKHVTVDAKSIGFKNPFSAVMVKKRLAHFLLILKIKLSRAPKSF